MDIDNMTIGELKLLVRMAQHDKIRLGAVAPVEHFDNGLTGKYVIVRCCDAGVHAGILVRHNGRECVLNEARRLWYWKPANGGAFLSGVASEGLHPDSKVGAPITVHLTENCEIIQCSHTAQASITGAPNYVPR